MNKVLEFIKKYNELIISIIIISIVGITFFIDEMSLLLLFFVIFTGLFLNNNTLFCIISLLIPLQVIIAVPIAKMFYLITTFCLIYVLKNYVLNILKKKKIFNWKLFLVAIIVCLYAFLFPTHITSSGNNFVFIINILSIILAYEHRKELNLAKIVEYYCIGILLSGLIWFFREESEILKLVLSTLDKRYVNGFEKFIGCFTHPNIFAFYDTVAIGGLYFCFYKKQMPIAKFLVYFIGCFIYGYSTVSRSFLLSIVIATAILYFLLLLRDKQKSFKFLLPFTAVLILLCLIFSEQTYNMIFRSTDFYESNYQNRFEEVNNNDWDLIFKGLIHFDPGRVGIWLMYMKYFLMYPFDLIFGKGNGALKIAKAKAHNFVLDSLYIHGIVGSLLFMLFYFMVFGGKKLFNIKKNKDILLFIAPFLIFMLLDPMEFNMVFIGVIGIAKLQDDSYIETDNEIKMYEMIESNRKIKFMSKKI